jgi:pyrimidine deaminase RibD-like protein
MNIVSKNKTSRAAICRKWKITAATLAAWELEGIDIHDDEQMSERNARKHGGSNGAEMAAARLRKLKAEARTAEMKAAEMEGRLIGIDEVEAAFTKLGSITKSLMIRLQADLPPMLEGQTPSRMQAIIAQAVESVLRSMSDPEMQHWKK